MRVLREAVTVQLLFPINWKVMKRVLQLASSMTLLLQLLNRIGLQFE